MLFSSGPVAPLSCWKPSFAVGHPKQGNFNIWSSLFDVLSGAACCPAREGLRYFGNFNLELRYSGILQSCKLNLFSLRSGRR